MQDFASRCEVFDVRTREKLFEISDVCERPIKPFYEHVRFEFSRNGRWIGVGPDISHAYHRLFDAETGKEFEPSSHFSFSETGSMFFAQSDEKQRRFNAGDGAPLETSKSAWSQDCSSHSERLVLEMRHDDSCDEDAYRVRDLGTNTILFCCDEALGARLRGIRARSVDFNNVDCNYQIVDFPGPGVAMSEPDVEIQNLFSPDDRWLAIMDHDVRRFVDLESGKVTLTFSGSRIRFSSNSSLVACERENTVHVFSTDTWRECATISGFNAEFTGDGSVLVTEGTREQENRADPFMSPPPRTLDRQLWNARTNTLKYVLPCKCSSLNLSANGRRAMADLSGKAYSWNFDNGADSESVYGETVLAPNRRCEVLTATTEKWRKPNDSKLLDADSGEVLFDFGVPFWAAKFAPDSERIVALHADHTLRLWSKLRPERWWGVFWLPELYVTALFLALFIASLRRDCLSSTPSGTLGRL